MNTYRLTILLGFAILVTLFFTACSHPQTKVCQEIDWHELGRQDGAHGLAEAKRRPVQPVCEETDPSLTEALYHNGFDYGISNLCTFENGLELGQKNTPVADVCPLLLKDEFLLGYQRGQRLTELKKTSTDIQAKMKAVELKLEEPLLSLSKKGLLNGEKIELKQKAQNLDQELKQLTKREQAPSQN